MPLATRAGQIFRGVVFFFIFSAIDKVCVKILIKLFIVFFSIRFYQDIKVEILNSNID